MEDVSPKAIQKFEEELASRLGSTFTPEQVDVIKDLIRLELMKSESDRFKELRG